jgi:hypothetical protein
VVKVKALYQKGALPLQRDFAATRNATIRGEELTEGEQLAQAQR